MAFADCLSWLKHQFRSRKVSRPRRGNPLSHFAAQISLTPLEDRCLLSTSVLGHETQVSQQFGSPQFSTQSDRSLAVTTSGTVITAWSSGDGNGSRIVARRVGPDGNPLGSEFQVSTSGGLVHSNAVIATYGDDRFVIAWVSRGNPQDPSGTGVFARVFQGNGVAITGEIRVNGTVLGNQGDPSVAWISASQFVVAWAGAGWRVAQTVAPRPPRVPGQTQVGPGTVIVRDYQTVFARIFHLSGKPVTNDIRVPQTLALAQFNPAVIALPNGGFQVAWNGTGPGDPHGIFSRQFNHAGQPLGAEFRVNTSRSAVELQPAIALNGQQVVITWQAVGNALDRTGWGIVGRRFGLNGTPLSGEFLVNDNMQGHQVDPSIAFLEDGGFTVAWSGSGTGDQDGVHVREFESNGTQRGGSRLVNSTVSGVQAHPTVARNGSGYLVGWSANSGTGIAVQVYSEPYLLVADANTVGTDALDRNKVLFFGYDKNLVHQLDVPVKTITIKNNSLETVYPILKSANSKTIGAGNKSGLDPNKGLYDPYDDTNQEYRGYLGYEKDGKMYFGLPKGESITIQVPLVFWDAGRMYIATDGRDMIPKPGPSTPTNPNPFHYYDIDPFDHNKTLRYMDAQGVGGTLANGRVMWYHARSAGTGFAEDLAVDAPTQLTEYTIRDRIMGDPSFLSSKDINTSEQKDLINYDVSYVDSMALPIAMAAQNVPIPNFPSEPKKPYGWTGAKLSVEDMQKVIAVFTSPNTTESPNLNGLGMYFGVHGYPEFYSPYATEVTKDMNGNVIPFDIKLPSGQNLFLQSPLKDVASAYNSNVYSLTSGGSGVFQIDGGFAGRTDGTTNTITLVAADAKPDKIKDLLAGLNNGGWEVTASVIDGKATVKKVEPVQTNDGPSYLVTLDDAHIPRKTPDTGAGFAFTRPLHDYAVEKLTSLWYSWAKYYVDYVQSAHPGFQELHKDGTIKIDGGSPTNELTIAGDVSALLVEGMSVTSDEAILNPGTSILSIKVVGSNTVVGLSKLPVDTIGDGTHSYKFNLPQMIGASDPPAEQVKTFDIRFDTPDPNNPPEKFARSVYQILDAMTTTVKADRGPKVLQIMTNAIGGNIGFIPFIGVSAPGDNAGFKYDGKFTTIATDIRDKIKSVMRGVWDFNLVKEDSSTGWYPDPSLMGAVTHQKVDLHDGAGFKDATYNVLNMNPFVWFVHTKLGLSGYGFSLDDDVADVGAEGATELRMTIGGITPGLDQTAEWTPGAPFGPIETSGTIKDGEPNKLYIDDPKILSQVFGPSDTGAGARVTLASGSGTFPAGTRISAPVGYLLGYVELDYNNGTPPAPGTYNIRFS